MKIRTAQDVEELDKKIKDELGIDVRKYRNEEVAENFVELLVFPSYVISWVIRPVMVSFVLYIVGFSLLDLVHVEYGLYGILGLVLFLINGVLAGLLFLTWKMKSDMWSVINYTLDILKTAVEDLTHLNKGVNKGNRKEVLSLLFKGIIHIVTIPMISKIIGDKVPLIGSFINKIATKVLANVANKIKLDEKEYAILEKQGAEGNVLQVYLNSISSLSVALEKTMNITFGITRFPLKIVFGLVFLVLVLFIYLIN